MRKHDKLWTTKRIGTDFIIDECKKQVTIMQDKQPFAYPST